MALLQWPQQQRWNDRHDRLWQALNARHGRQNGTRLMVEVIRLGRQHGYVKRIRRGRQSSNPYKLNMPLLKEHAARAKAQEDQEKALIDQRRIVIDPHPYRCLEDLPLTAEEKQLIGRYEFVDEDLDIDQSLWTEIDKPGTPNCNGAEILASCTTCCRARTKALCSRSTLTGNVHVCFRMKNRPLS